MIDRPAHHYRHISLISYENVKILKRISRGHCNIEINHRLLWRWWDPLQQRRNRTVNYDHVVAPTWHLQPRHQPRCVSQTLMYCVNKSLGGIYQYLYAFLNFVYWSLIFPDTSDNLSPWERKMLIIYYLFEPRIVFVIEPQILNRIRTKLITFLFNIEMFWKELYILE